MARKKNKKYEILPEVEVTINGHELHRIVATRDIYLSRLYTQIKKGAVGGLIESESNLSQDGDSWVLCNAAVYGGAHVKDNAVVTARAQVYDSAVISEYAIITQNAYVYGDARVRSFARILGKARVYGLTVVTDHSTISGEAKVYGDAYVSDSSRVGDKAKVYGYAKLFGFARVSGRAKVWGNAVIRDSASVYGNAKVCGDALVGGRSNIYGEAQVGQHMTIETHADVTCNLLDRENLAANILAQTGLVPLRGKVIAYKQVSKDMTSFWDSDFKYRVGKWAVAPNVEESDASCASGLHFSSADYWNNMHPAEDSIFLIAEIHLEDIVTIQEGKIRCRKAFIKGKFSL